MEIVNEQIKSYNGIFNERGNWGKNELEFYYQDTLDWMESTKLDIISKCSSTATAKKIIVPSPAKTKKKLSIKVSKNIRMPLMPINLNGSNNTSNIGIGNEKNSFMRMDSIKSVISEPIRTGHQLHLAQIEEYNNRYFQEKAAALIVPAPSVTTSTKKAAGLLERLKAATTSSNNISVIHQSNNTSNNSSSNDISQLNNISVIQPSSSSAPNLVAERILGRKIGEQISASISSAKKPLTSSSENITKPTLLADENDVSRVLDFDAKSAVLKRKADETAPVDQQKPTKRTSTEKDKLLSFVAPTTPASASINLAKDIANKKKLQQAVAQQSAATVNSIVTSTKAAIDAKLKKVKEDEKRRQEEEMERMKKRDEELKMREAARRADEEAKLAEKRKKNDERLKKNEELKAAQRQEEERKIREQEEQEAAKKKREEELEIRRKLVELAQKQEKAERKKEEEERRRQYEIARQQEMQQKILLRQQQKTPVKTPNKVATPRSAAAIPSSPYVSSGIIGDIFGKLAHAVGLSNANTLPKYNQDEDEEVEFEVEDEDEDEEEEEDVDADVEGEEEEEEVEEGEVTDDENQDIDEIGGSPIMPPIQMTPSPSKKHVNYSPASSLASDQESPLRRGGENSYGGFSPSVLTNVPTLPSSITESPISPGLTRRFTATQKQRSPIAYNLKSLEESPVSPVHINKKNNNNNSNNSSSHTSFEYEDEDEEEEVDDDEEVDEEEEDQEQDDEDDNNSSEQDDLEDVFVEVREEIEDPVDQVDIVVEEPVPFRNHGFPISDMEPDEDDDGMYLDEDESIDESLVPSWAKEPAFTEELRNQTRKHVDPDSIFPRVSRVLLKEIFNQKSHDAIHRYDGNVSQDWTKDSMTGEEDLRYKRMMGYPISDLLLKKFKPNYKS